MFSVLFPSFLLLPLTCQGLHIQGDIPNRTPPLPSGKPNFLPPPLSKILCLPSLSNHTRITPTYYQLFPLYHHSLLILVGNPPPILPAPPPYNTCHYFPRLKLSLCSQGSYSETHSPPREHSALSQTSHASLALV